MTKRSAGKVVTFFTGLVLVVSLFGCGSQIDKNGGFVSSKAEDPQVIINLSDVESPSISNGKIVYIKYCLFCHGTDGKGDGSASKTFGFKIPDLHDRSMFETKSIKETIQQIARGKFLNSMPAYFSILSKEEIADVAVYSNSFLTTSNGVSSGKIIYEKHCFSCHGPEGKGDGKVLSVRSERADLTNFSRAAGFSRNDLNKVINEGIQDRSMPAFNTVIASNDMNNLLDYLSVFTYNH